MVLVCCTSLQQGYLQSLKKHTPVLYDLGWKKESMTKIYPTHFEPEVILSMS